MNGRDIPLGLSMALAQNMDAMSRFSTMSDREKERFIACAHQVQSKTEMQRLVDQLAGAPDTAL